MSEEEITPINDPTPFIGYDLLYPPSLKQGILSGKNIEIMELSKKGIILVFDLILPKEKSTLENFSEIPKMFCNPNGRTLIIDLDEISDILQAKCEFIRETGIWGDFPLWIFERVFWLSDLFDDKKIREIERRESPQMANFISLKVHKKKNYALEKTGYDHNCVFISTRESLLSNSAGLEELHRKSLEKLANGGNTKVKRRKTNFTKSIRHEVFKRDGYKCCECSKTKEETSLEIDHIIPISRGGTDELENLQTLCTACNLAKSNRIFRAS